MEMTRVEARQFHEKIEGVLKSDAELSFDVVYAMTKTKSKMKPIIDDIGDYLSSSTRTERQLAIKHCRKNDKGKPVIEGDRYAGLEPGVCKEYDEEAEQLVSKRSGYFKEMVEVYIHYIEKDALPKTGKASVMEILCSFLRE